jgi:hypothetical protein
MVKKKVAILSVFLVVLVAGLSGCLDEKSKFIGTWKSGETTVTFNSNTATFTGTGPLGLASLTGSFNYTVANNKITFSSGTLPVGITLNYGFSDSKLTISNNAGQSLIFTKV